MQFTATTTPASIFDALCPDCGSTLAPDLAWVWRCGGCGQRFERCGLHLVAVQTLTQEVIST